MKTRIYAAPEVKGLKYGVLQGGGGKYKPQVGMVGGVLYSWYLLSEWVHRAHYHDYVNPSFFYYAAERNKGVHTTYSCYTPLYSTF